MKIAKPKTGEFAPSTIQYIRLLPDDELVLRHLADNVKSTIEFVLSLPTEKLDYRYAPGKWTIKEMMVHVADTERIFGFRALCFARNEKIDLPGFDENHYAARSNAQTRDIKDILREFVAVRNATLSLFAAFDEKVLTAIGRANRNPTSVRALAYQIAGHELHHRNVIKERYL